jgi:hypothetical protein
VSQAEEMQQLLDADLDDVEGRAIEQIRELRAACVEVETGLSYLRRMVQGPLDITRRELARRRSGDGADLAQLIDELPEVLADGPRTSGVGRPFQTLEPTAVDAALSAELDAIIGDGGIGHITEMPDEALDEMIASLEAFERKVSERRRSFHQRIDLLQAELTRRYRTGEASVDALLD